MRLVFCLISLVMVSFLSCRDKGFDKDAAGIFEATEVLVSSEAQGKIMELNLEEGDLLDAGDVYGYVDSTQLYLKKRQLLAGMRSVDIRRPDIRKQIAVIEQQIATARTEQRRMENLVKANVGNQKQVDDLVNQIAVLEKELSAQRSTLDKTDEGADAEVENLQYQVMQIDDQLTKCCIVAPQSGVVLVKYAEAGEITSPGKPLFSMADVSVMYLRAYITASQLSRLKLGQKAMVYADYEENGQREYSGVVSWISDKAEFTPKGIQTRNERANSVYAVKIAVKNNGYLKIGQYGEVDFLIDEK